MVVARLGWVSSSGRWGFVDRFGLWGDEDKRQGREVLARIARDDLRWMRVAFVDQHGTVRCKTVPARAMDRVFANGLTAPISILAKDTSDRTVFPVFTREGILGVPETQGAGDMVLVPDPRTFRVLPWLEKTGWVLCDLYFPSGQRVPFCTRGLCRGIVDTLRTSGLEHRVGLEVEFHIFEIRDIQRSARELTWPAHPPEVAVVSSGYRLLGQGQWDAVEERLMRLRDMLERLGIEVRSLELEFGPSQVEITVDASEALTAADTMVLFRTAAKEILRREGLHACFMPRPSFPNLFSSGWHLHQSIVDVHSGENVFMGRQEGERISQFGRQFIAGLLAHAGAGSVFACPTINGYKRYRPFGLAPDRRCWAFDNKGAMLRVISGGPWDPSTRVENRAGDPAANPYLYIAAQIVAGMEGVRRALEPGEPVEEPYGASAPLLPRTLEQALDELKKDELFRERFGEIFVEYIVRIKEAELRRFYDCVTEWEQREYFDLF